MIRSAPPLRFLAVVLVGWVCVRAAMLASEDEARHPRVASTRAIAAPAPTPALETALPLRRDTLVAAESALRRFRQAAMAAPGSPIFRSAPPVVASGPVVLPIPHNPIVANAPAAAASAVLPQPSLAGPPYAAPRESRWSGSAWLHLRRDGTGTLAPGGTLGGSQAGGRLSYRINGDPRRPLAISGRIYVPTDRLRGAEAAIGIDWRPVANVPIHILAERRQRIGREGRSDFAISAYGGVSDRPLGAGLRIDAYAQAGLVSHRTRDAFVDGSARVSARSGAVDIGGGIWGAAQPGVSRLDVGPQASLRIPGGAGLRLSADWRFRIAGSAAPSSGPSLTLSSDF